MQPLVIFLGALFVEFWIMGFVLIVLATLGKEV